VPTFLSNWIWNSCVSVQELLLTAANFSGGKI